ncbi:MAG: hypothetical protein MUF59_06935 [Candidatus Krumholzibacteria bacterium]|jgi:glutathione synthase/RimK-type ligase-like ATP-grasp enzyme|nr:hypothetical protein [Candidatus Krumholzibacteria bacterium]
MAGNMTEPEILILTEKNGFFGQTRKPWVSIDTGAFIEAFRAGGFKMETGTFDEMANLGRDIRDRVIIYTFTQKFHVRQYVKDVVFALSKKNMIIPSYDMLKCHEDKGYQELFKKEAGIGSLRAFYFSDPAAVWKHDFTWPAVLKSIEGSNGKQVWLARNRDELEKLLKRHFISVPARDRLDLLRRKYFRAKKSYGEYPEYTNEKDLEQYREYVTDYRPFIIQEYVPGLEHDYRVLVLYDRLYVTKRHVRDNDFRASGAKKFDFDFEPDGALLDFASGIFRKISQPVLSLDICEKNGSYYLLEFQALHFGINVFVKSKGYYSRTGGEWKFSERTAGFERELAEAFMKHLRGAGA